MKLDHYYFNEDGTEKDITQAELEQAIDIVNATKLTAEQLYILDRVLTALVRDNDDMTRGEAVFRLSHLAQAKHQQS